MRYLLLVVFLAACAFRAEAAPQFCTGKITRLSTYQDGSLFMLPDWRQDWVSVCNLTAARGGVSPATCAAWFATLKSAATAQGTFSTVTYYPDAPSCSTLPTQGASPVPG